MIIRKIDRVQRLRCLLVNGQIAAAFEPNVYKFILFYEKRDVKKNRELNSIKNDFVAYFQRNRE